jgi:L-amino acid N-acyltransferase YncA
MEINIRLALDEKDLEEIVAINNQAIKTKRLVAYTDEFKIEDRREWFHEHTKDKYPILVAENNNTILGWTSISPYRTGRKALSKTVEVSYFIHNEYQRKGIGSKLLAELLKTAKNLGYETIIAIIFDKNIGSEKLLEKFKFEKWGVLPDVAEVGGQKMSHVYYGIKL